MDLASTRDSAAYRRMLKLKRFIQQAASCFGCVPDAKKQVHLVWAFTNDVAAASLVPSPAQVVPTQCPAPAPQPAPLALSKWAQIAHNAHAQPVVLLLLDIEGGQVLWSNRDIDFTLLASVGPASLLSSPNNLHGASEDGTGHAKIHFLSALLGNQYQVSDVLDTVHHQGIWCGNVSSNMAGCLVELQCNPDAVPGDFPNASVIRLTDAGQPNCWTAQSEQELSLSGGPRQRPAAKASNQAPHLLTTTATTTTSSHASQVQPQRQFARQSTPQLPPTRRRRSSSGSDDVYNFASKLFKTPPSVHVTNLHTNVHVTNLHKSGSFTSSVLHTDPLGEDRLSPIEEQLSLDDQATPTSARLPRCAGADCIPTVATPARADRTAVYRLTEKGISVGEVQVSMTDVAVTGPSTSLEKSTSRGKLQDRQQASCTSNVDPTILTITTTTPTACAQPPSDTPDQPPPPPPRVPRVRFVVGTRYDDDTQPKHLAGSSCGSEGHESDVILGSAGTMPRQAFDAGHESGGESGRTSHGSATSTKSSRPQRRKPARYRSMSARLLRPQQAEPKPHDRSSSHEFERKPLPSSRALSRQSSTASQKQERHTSGHGTSQPRVSVNETRSLRVGSMSGFQSSLFTDDDRNARKGSMDTLSMHMLTHRLQLGPKTSAILQSMGMSQLLSNPSPDLHNQPTNSSRTGASASSSHALPSSLQLAGPIVHPTSPVMALSLAGSADLKQAAAGEQTDVAYNSTTLSKINEQVLSDGALPLPAIGQHLPYSRVCSSDRSEALSCIRKPSELAQHSSSKASDLGLPSTSAAASRALAELQGGVISVVAHVSTPGIAMSGNTLAGSSTGFDKLGQVAQKDMANSVQGNPLPTMLATAATMAATQGICSPCASPRCPRSVEELVPPDDDPGLHTSQASSAHAVPLPSLALETNSSHHDAADNSGHEDVCMSSVASTIHAGHEADEQAHALVAEVKVQLVQNESRPLLLLSCTDISARAAVEGLLTQLMESQLSMVSSLFPYHVLEHLCKSTNATSNPGNNKAHHQSSSSADSHNIGAGLPLGNTANVTKSDTIAKRHEDATVLFMDIVGFTNMSKELEPHQVLSYLNELFSYFDELVSVHGVHKIETAGDCYIVCAGVVEVGAGGFLHVMQSHDQHDSARRVLAFAHDMLACSRTVLMPHNQSPTCVRVGIHTGTCMSGLIGSKLPKFSIYGDSVNTASRLESTGQPGRIQVSEATRQLLPDENWEPTGGVSMKGKGVVPTYYWVPHTLGAPDDPDAARSSKAESDKLLAESLKHSCAKSALFHQVQRNTLPHLLMYAEPGKRNAHHVIASGVHIGSEFTSPTMSVSRRTTQDGDLLNTQTLSKPGNCRSEDPPHRQSDACRKHSSHGKSQNGSHCLVETLEQIPSLTREAAVDVPQQQQPRASPQVFTLPPVLLKQLSENHHARSALPTGLFERMIRVKPGQLVADAAQLQARSQSGAVRDSMLSSGEEQVDPYRSA